MKRRHFLSGIAGTALAAAALPARSATAKGYDFIQVDVFTHNPLEGNPLAVFVSAAGMSDAQMQNIARELNHSETTFILPATAGGDARVRIFGTNN
jgi:PhzF family phenazine biosynthesis protein